MKTVLFHRNRKCLHKVYLDLNINTTMNRVCGDAMPCNEQNCSCTMLCLVCTVLHTPNRVHDDDMFSSKFVENVFIRFFGTHRTHDFGTVLSFVWISSALLILLQAPKSHNPHFIEDRSFWVNRWCCWLPVFHLFDGCKKRQNKCQFWFVCVEIAIEILGRSNKTSIWFSSYTLWFHSWRFCHLSQNLWNFSVKLH